MTLSYDLLFDIVLCALAPMLFACLIRAIRGPRIADRVIGINMIGTIVIMMIAILAVKMQAGYLVDVALIYAMLSFLAVVVLCRIYIGVYRAEKEQEERENRNA